LTENSLRYDWTVVSDKQNSLAFLTLDENIRLIDKALFSNIFKYIVSYKDIKSFNLERLDFNLNLKCDFIVDVDNFFLSSRNEFSNLFKISTFCCGDMKLLSPEYYDFYPILKLYFFNFFLSSPGIIPGFGYRKYDDEGSFNNYSKYLDFFTDNQENLEIDDLNLNYYKHTFYPYGGDFLLDKCFVLFSDL